MPRQTMRSFTEVLRQANKEVYNPVGLNILDPLKVAYLFVRPPAHTMPPCSLTGSLEDSSKLNTINSHPKHR